MHHWLCIHDFGPLQIAEDFDWAPPSRPTLWIPHFVANEPFDQSGNCVPIHAWMDRCMLDRGMVHHTDSIDRELFIVQFKLNSVNWVELCIQPSNLGDLHCHKPWHHSANDVSASHHGSRKRYNPKASFKKKGTPRNLRNAWWKLAQMM